MHEKSPNSAVIKSRTARRYGVPPPSSSSSVLSISAIGRHHHADIGIARRFGPSIENNAKFAWGMMEANEKKNKSGWLESKVHLHAIYIILCVVILNMVVLLCLLHFKLILIVPFENGNTNQTKALNLLANKSAKIEQRTKLAKMKQNQQMGLMENGTREQSNDLSVNLAKIVRPFEAIIDGRTMEKRGEESRQSREKQSVEIIGMENVQLEDNIWEMPLKKIELHLKKEQLIEQKQQQNGTNIEADCSNCNYSPPIAAGQQPIQPILTFYRSRSATSSSQQFLVDCQKEEDSQGREKCIQWGKAGFCESHLATKWLFCRKHCLCP